MRVQTVYLISLYSIGWKSAAHCRGESVQKETLSRFDVLPSDRIHLYEPPEPNDAAGGYSRHQSPPDL
jgi:hypothetical protein